eukprot:Em0003g1644a
MASSKAPCMQGARTLLSLTKFGFTCTAKIKDPEVAACNKGDNIGDIGVASAPEIPNGTNAFTSVVWGPDDCHSSVRQTTASAVTSRGSTAKTASKRAVDTSTNSPTSKKKKLASDCSNNPVSCYRSSCGSAASTVVIGIDHDKLQDKAVIAEEEVEEQQQQEMAENTTLNQASAAAWDPAIRNQLTPHKDDKHWHNDCRQGRFCILQDAYPTKQYGGRGRKRAVQKSWLESYGWLEWSQEENPLFCYPCWIFNSKRDNEWCCRIDAARCCKQHGGLGTAHPTRATRPVVTPDAYTGDSSWTDWAVHFEAVAKTAWNRLLDETKGDFQAAMDALRNRFEPSSKRERYAAEFRLRKRKNGEQWGDFADQLQCLADKAFPTLSEDAKEVLTLDKYLAFVHQIPLTLLIDIGAAVSLLGKEQWMRLGGAKFTMEQWNKGTLVGVNGSPVGVVSMDIVVGGQRLAVEFVVVTSGFCNWKDATVAFSKHLQSKSHIEAVSDDFTVSEEFVGLYYLSVIDAQSIVDAIKDAFLRFLIPFTKLRGQCYDGCSTMAGARAGVAVKIQELEPRAVFTHCYGHVLNLAVNDTITKVPKMKDCLDTCYEIVKLIKFSPKREAMLSQLKEEMGSDAPGVRTLCPTRWTVLAESLYSILANYDHILLLWETGVHETSNTEMKARILGVRSQMQSFNFLFCIVLSEMILRHTDKLSKTLQQPNLSSIEGHDIAMLTVKTLEGLRNENDFELFWQNIEKMRVQFDIDEPLLPRKQKVSQRFETGIALAEFATSPKDEYRRVFFECFDLAVMSIRSRFDQNGFKTFSNVEQLLFKARKGQNYEEELDFVCNFLTNDFNKIELAAELLTLRTLYGTEVAADEKPSVNSIKTALLAMQRKLLGAVVRLFQLLVTLPATNATSEQSFSALCRIKSYLRSTMSQTAAPALLSVQSLLGIDFLKRHACVIDVPNMVMQCHGLKIPLETAGTWSKVEVLASTNSLCGSGTWLVEGLRDKNVPQVLVAGAVVKPIQDHVLANKDEDLGRTAVVHHSIITGDAPPIKQPSRPIPVASQHEVRKLLDEMLQKYVIQPSASPWASPVVLVQKKDGHKISCEGISTDSSKVDVVNKWSTPATVQELQKFLGLAGYYKRTDHSALQWLYSFKEPEGQTARWLEMLQEFDFEVGGRIMGMLTPFPDPTSILVKKLALLRHREFTQLVEQWNQLVLKDAVLYRHHEDANGYSHLQLIVPKETVTVAEILVEEIFCRFSIPEQLHSDQGQQFEGKLMQEVCKLLHINKTWTTAYHPQSDDVVERLNQTLLSMLAATVHEHPGDWDKKLRLMCMAYNTSVHQSTGFSPFFQLFGRQARLPVDLMEEMTTKEYVRNLRQTLEKAYSNHTGAALERQKELHDRRVHGDEYQPCPSMRAEIPGLDHSPQEVEKQLPLLQKHRHVGTDLRIVDDDEEVLEIQPRDRGQMRKPGQQELPESQAYEDGHEALESDVQNG